MTPEIRLGHISGCFGVKGWIKVFSYTEPTDNIFSYHDWILCQGDFSRIYKLVSGETSGKKLIAKLAGVDDRDAAESLTGHNIFVKQSDLPKLAEGEFYWYELIGSKVINSQGKVMGTLNDVMATGANDVMIVINAQQRILIPYTYGTHVLAVDLDDKIITVDWSEFEDG